MTTTVQSDVPLVNVPFVDPKTGTVTEAWFLFLIQLWRRTGGANGEIPGAITLDDVFSVEQTFPSIATQPQQDAIASDVTTAVPSRQEALLEMIFAPIAPIVDIVDNTFTAGVDFTPGTTSSLTLSRSFGSISRLWIFFDAAFQGDDQVASLVGANLTFTSPIPVGVNKVYVKGLVTG
jgi:hypothetical protein